jgi:hypothetical protein
LIVGDVLVVPGGDGEVDEVQLVTVMSNAWSASSISSRYGVVVRLETCRAAGCFGLMKGSSICCEIKQTKDVREAPGLEEENGPEEEVIGSPSTADFERICPQALRTPASDFAGLAAL